jgi:PAS domain-containing protein
MTSASDSADAVGQLLETPDLATALESEQFKKFLDQVPIAIAVSDLSRAERVVYANPEFEKLAGLRAATLAKENWNALIGVGLNNNRDHSLSDAVVSQTDFVGTYKLERGSDVQTIVDALLHLINIA